MRTQVRFPGQVATPLTTKHPVQLCPSRLYPSSYRKISQSIDHEIWFNMGVSPCNWTGASTDLLPIRSSKFSNISQTQFSSPTTHFSDVKSFRDFVQGSNIVVFCAKFPNDWATKIDDMDERDFARFQFKIRFRGTSDIVTVPECRDDVHSPKKFSNTWWWNCGSRNYNKTWDAGCT